MEETEKKDIQDADIDQVDQEKKDKKNYRVEIVLIFVIGFLVGAMVKAEATKNISIGFNDYKVTSASQGYDIEAIEKNLFEKAEEAAAEKEAGAIEEIQQ